MEDKYIKVEGEIGLVRDRESGAILNTNVSEIKTAKIRKAHRRNKDAEMQKLKDDVQQIKSMLNQLMDKI
jgi:hypothetical protein